MPLRLFNRTTGKSVLAIEAFNLVDMKNIKLLKIYLLSSLPLDGRTTEQSNDANHSVYDKDNFNTELKLFFSHAQFCICQAFDLLHLYGYIDKFLKRVSKMIKWNGSKDQINVLIARNNFCFRSTL
ncbi:hypothetical protein T4A_8144 [Trichinella pseudospiralis]|uniref:Uncharacterized protein n=1 Tax=Trichinella pseudospiralis TaxID=6337 RepID=A0A0V1EJW5_TRIPS|nr:hypothetical protein T4A_8144 [Trichinella pseudospiralis]